MKIIKEKKSKYYKFIRYILNNKKQYSIGVYNSECGHTSKKFSIELHELNPGCNIKTLYIYKEENFISMTRSLNNFFTELYNLKLIDDINFVNMCINISKYEEYELDEEFINTDMYIKWKLKN